MHIVSRVNDLIQGVPPHSTTPSLIRMIPIIRPLLQKVMHVLISLHLLTVQPYDIPDPINKRNGSRIEDSAGARPVRLSNLIS